MTTMIGKQRKEKTKVSIITVVYNGATYIRYCIESVIAQNYSNIEYIIMDGGSTDGTIDIIKEYENQISYWESGKDKSMYDAINKGMRKSTGEIIASLNSDDIYYSNDVISEVVSKYEKYGNLHSLYYCDMIKEENQNQRYIKLFQVSADALIASCHSTFVPQPCSFMTKEAVDKCGEFDIQYRFASDYDYMIRLSQYKSPKYLSNVCSTVFRRHDETLTHVQAQKMNEERQSILSRYPVKEPKKFFFKYYYWGIYILINKILKFRS